MRRLFDFQVVRFIAVGVLNTGFSYGIYSLGLACGLPYALANLIALVAGILFSFRTQGALVFHNRETRLLGRFALFWLIMFGLNTGLIALFMQAGFNAYAAGALALLPMTVLSYFVQKFMVFGPRRSVRAAKSV